MLFNCLKKRIGDFGIKGIVISFVRILLASVGMGLVCYFVLRQAVHLNKFLSLGLEITAGLISYIFFCFIFKVKEMRQLWDWLARGAGARLDSQTVQD